MTKQLTLSEIKKQDKQFENKKRILLGESGEYYVDINIKFRPTLIQQMIAELTDKMLQIKEQNIEFKYMDIYSLLLLIKYFTSFKVPDELSEQIKVLELLIDGGYFGAIVNEFDEEELKKVADTIKKAGEFLPKYFEQIIENNQETVVG